VTLILGLCRESQDVLSVLEKVLGELVLLIDLRKVSNLICT
jgi:hypothetical protein